MSPRTISHGLLILAGLSLVAQLDAQTRYARHLGLEQGLIPAFVASLAQDPDGPLWIGSAGGLYRYDGVEMRRWAPEILRSWVSVLAVAPDGGLIALDEDQGGVFAVVPDGVRPVTGPANERAHSGAGVPSAPHPAHRPGGANAVSSTSVLITARGK